MKVQIAYNPDRLWINAPFYANRATSIPRWERQACSLLQLDGYTVEFEEDYDLPTAWDIAGANVRNRRAIDTALTLVSDGNWFDYSRQERADYEYGVG